MTIRFFRAAALFCAAAFCVSSAAFALPSPQQVRQAAHKVEQTLPQQEVTPEELEKAALAVMAGLQAVQERSQAEQLTPADKQIMELLDVTIPAALNKVQKSLSEAQADLEKLSRQLAELVVNNQKEYPNPNMEVAAALVQQTALTNALLSGKIEDRVLKIIQEEAVQELEQMFSAPEQ